MGITDSDSGSDNDSDDVDDDELDNVSAQASSIIPGKASSLFLFSPNLSLSTVSTNINNIHRSTQLAFLLVLPFVRLHLNDFMNS